MKVRGDVADVMRSQPVKRQVERELACAPSITKCEREAHHRLPVDVFVAIGYKSPLSSRSGLKHECNYDGLSKHKHGHEQGGRESTGVQHVQEESGRVSIRVVLSHQSSPRTHSTYRVSGVRMGIAPSRRPCLARVARALRTYPRATVHAPLPSPTSPPTPISPAEAGLDLDSGDYRPVALDTARMVMGIARSARICASGSASSSFRTRRPPPRPVRSESTAARSPRLPRHRGSRSVALDTAGMCITTPSTHALLLAFPFGRSACACVLVRTSSSYIESTVAREAGSGSRSMHPRSPARLDGIGLSPPNSSTGGSALTSTSLLITRCVIFALPAYCLHLFTPTPNPPPLPLNINPPRSPEHQPTHGHSRPAPPQTTSTPSSRARMATRAPHPTRTRNPPPLHPRLALFVEPARAKQSGMELALDAAEGGERRYAEGGEGEVQPAECVCAVFLCVADSGAGGDCGEQQQEGRLGRCKKGTKDLHVSAWCCTKRCWGGGAYGQQLPLRSAGPGTARVAALGDDPDPVLRARHSSVTSSASSDSDSSRPRLADALQRVSFSPKRPRSPHAPHHPQPLPCPSAPSPLTQPITDSRNIPTPRPNCRSLRAVWHAISLKSSSGIFSHARASESRSNLSIADSVIASTSTSMMHEPRDERSFSPTPELHKSKSLMFSSLRKVSKRNLRSSKYTHRPSSPAPVLACRRFMRDTGWWYMDLRSKGAGDGRGRTLCDALVLVPALGDVPSPPSPVLHKSISSASLLLHERAVSGLTGHSGVSNLCTR
ncbi:hypothetical protein B0H14DRAFT_3690923 [Mycena olivaceomarginata]|nr:hypothetical protein B0H14DRAFT_3690923 [Mycena olivaceomarginata]